MFGTIVRLSHEDLKYFGFKAKENRIYAIRMDELQTTTRCSYHTKAQVVKSSFLGTHYLNIGILPNKTKINFMTSKLWRVYLGLIPLQFLNFRRTTKLIPKRGKCTFKILEFCSIILVL